MVVGEEGPDSRPQDPMESIRQRIAAGAAAARPEAVPQNRRLKLAALSSQLQERMAAHRDRVAVPHPALAAARSLAEQSLSRREQLKAHKNENRDLNSQFREALSIKAHNEAEYKRITESISNATATNEKLKTSLMELRNKRDEYTAVISDPLLQDLEAREAKANEDAILLENIEARVSWFNKFLGLQVIAGEEGVKFVFNKIVPQHPEEYSFCIKIDNGTYKLVQCDLPLKDFEELVKDLNLSGDLLNFLKVAREKIQAAAVNGNLPLSSVACPVNSTSESIPSAPFPPLVANAVNLTSENISNQSNSQSKNKRLPAKRKSPAPSPGSVRRSPRLRGSISEKTETWKH